MRHNAQTRLQGAFVHTTIFLLLYGFIRLSSAVFALVTRACTHGFCFFAEYKNTGPGSKGTRVEWSHQLSDEEVIGYTPENILGEWVVSPQLFNNEIINTK